LTECPGWLLDLVCPVRTENLKTPSKKDAPAPVVPISDDLISDGERNHKLFRHAASLRGSAMNGNEILAALSIVNDERCVPPLNVDELQKIVKSVSRYEPNEIKKPLVMRRAQKAHLIEVQALLSDEATPYADEDWMGRLELTSEGKPFKNIANVVRVLEYHPEFNKAIAWNESTQRFVALRPTCAGRIPAGTALTDYHILELTVWIQSHTDVKVGEKVVNSAVETVGMRYAFHPIRDYLNGLKHDGVKRVDGWLTKYLGVKQTAYTDAVGRAWLVSAIARVMRPGCKADCGLILEGDTGLGKSTVFKVLGGEWFSESLKSMDQDKDALAQLRGKWIVEMAELSQMTRGEVSAIKHFMSTSVDTYRPSYGRRAQDFPRECIFGGTSNLNNYLKDETGNRRFWPVECQAVIDGKWIDRDGLQEDRDQLWAEALEMYEAGEKWYLDDPKVLRMSVEEQESRLELDPWHEPVIAYCEDKAKQDIKEELDTDALQRVKIEDILKGKFDHDGKVVVGIGKPIIQWTQADRLRIGRILKLEGWKRCQQRVPGMECVFTKAFPLKTGDR
jgi:predicted P-loop ATPase